MKEVVQEKVNAVTAYANRLLGRFECWNVIAHPAFIHVSLQNQRQEKRKEHCVWEHEYGPLHLEKTEIMDLSQA